MDKRLDELLAQLEQFSPMPDDDVVTQEELDAYKAVIFPLDEVLAHESDPRAIKPILASLGYHDGYDLYQSAAGLLRHFSHSQKLPYLIEAVQHGERGARMWAALELGYTRDPAVVQYLLPLLNDEAEHVRACAALALSNIGAPATRKAVEQLQNDPSPEVRDAVEIALEDWQTADS